MKKPCCRHCVYAIPLHVGRQTHWVCTNAPGMAGLLRPVKPAGGCRQYRKKRTQPLRLAPPESTDPTIRYIPLTQGLFALVDTADYEWVNQYRWCASGRGNRVYACRCDRHGKMILLHRFLTNCPKGLVVDHIDHNTLNDRQSNLRVCTQQQNLYNSRPKGKSSKYKGVCRDKAKKRWVVYVRYNGRNIFVGRFKDEIEAAKAYDRKAHELFGEYAYLNFPEEIGVAGREVTGDKRQVTSKK